MDRLRIKDLEVYAYHGVFESEKELGQRFILDVSLGYDMTRAAKTGDLTASIHYGELAEQLTLWCQKTKEDLIETLAHQLVEKIFQHYPLVQELDLEVKKPWAPVPLPLDTCSVALSRKKRRYFIGLGTNQGQREENLARALLELEQAGFVLLQKSSILETEPWGGVEQAAFLNQVVELESWQEPSEVMSMLLAIEEKMGRMREIKWGPRLIDLDILYIEDQVLYQPHLIVPHPYVAERAFVLQSLAELAPHFLDPVQKKSIRQLLEDAED